ncbi:MAG: Holliday junction resolvase RuvX [Serratia symbiotica]|nr:Holliday junction resolvase RuvX [Serratia symbiotica]
MSNRTIIAFDFGSKSIGAAIGHELTGSARALAAFKAQDGSPDWQKIAKLLQEWQPDLMVVGLPLNMDGSEQPVTEQARKFANRLHGRFGVQIALHDERLSTVEARANLFDRGGFHALDKGSVDSASAVVILESWFERQQG